jgi:predicted DNA-binding transcriptional regulator YafY
MTHPTTRVLAALELLQSRGRISGADLAQCLEVDRRTVRRYVALLEEIGVPITSERGRHGGYELIAGYKLPPMMFTNDEALALSLGLVAARGLGLEDGTQAVASARAKLERVMPAKILERVRAINETVELDNAFGRRPQEVTAALVALSTAAHLHQGIRLSYRRESGEESYRDFDPYGLARRVGRWYVVGYCHANKGLRTFRLDRVAAVTSQARKFDRPDGFDVLQHLDLSLATLPRKHSIEVLLDTDLPSAQREIYQALGVVETCEGGVLLRSQADDLRSFARELMRLPWPFTIRRPAALRKAVIACAREVIAMCLPG